VKSTLTAKGTVSAAITSAAALGILAGCLLAWLVFSTHLPAHLQYAGLAPAAALAVVYSTVVVVRLGHNENSLLKLVVAVLAGLFAALAVGAVLIEMIGCRYDRYACINL